MSPVTHLLLGWTVANTAKLEKRDRLLVTIAGVIPDLDGLGVIPEALTRGTSHEILWWTNYHHVLGHNLWFGLLCAGLAMLLARQRGLTFALFLASFHVHLLGDIVGARGPDGIWTIAYFWPYGAEWSWAGQWKLNSWPNLGITAVLLLLTFRWAWQRGYSPLEIISRRADQVFVETLRKRFPLPQPATEIKQA
jgi:hypothetical protein